MHEYILNNILENTWISDLYGSIQIGFTFDGNQYFIFDSSNNAIIDVFQTVGDFYVTENEIRMMYSDYEHRPYSIVLGK